MGRSAATGVGGSGFSGGIKQRRGVNPLTSQCQMTLRTAPKLDCHQGNQVLILESLVVKCSVWKAGKAGYKAGRAFAEGRAGVPAVVTDSLEKWLDELAPIEPHIGLASVDGNLAIVTIN